MTAIFSLSVRQLISRWRMIVIFLLSALIIGLASIISFFAGDEPGFDENFTDSLLDGMLIGGMMPLVTMVLATASFGHELDDRTLNFLVLKPIARWSIVLPKYGSIIAVAGPVVLGSGVAASLIAMDQSVQAALAVAVALAAGVATYAAIFNWAGLVTNRALAFALFYVLVWEGLISSFFGGVRYLSVRAYTLAIMYQGDQDRFDALDGRVIEAPAAIGAAVVVTGIFLALTVRRLRGMDVP